MLQCYYKAQARYENLTFYMLKNIKYFNRFDKKVTTSTGKDILNNEWVIKPKI